MNASTIRLQKEYLNVFLSLTLFIVAYCYPYHVGEFYFSSILFVLVLCPHIGSALKRSTINESLFWPKDKQGIPHRLSKKEVRRIYRRWLFVVIIPWIVFLLFRVYRGPYFMEDEKNFHETLDGFNLYFMYLSITKIIEYHKNPRNYFI